MSRGRSEKPVVVEPVKRRRYTEEFKAEAVQMLLDGHSAPSVCERLGLSGPNLLYAWKRRLIERGGSTAVGLEARVRELEAELRRVERERDILPLEMSIPLFLFSGFTLLEEWLFDAGFAGRALVSRRGSA